MHLTGASPLAKHKIFTQLHVKITILQVLDTVVTSLKDRFNQSSFVVYKNIESLLLETIKGEDTSDESECIKRKYNDEINITQFEIDANILRVILRKESGLL